MIIFQSKPAFAVDPTPTEAPQKQVTVEWMNSFKSEVENNAVISTIQSFLQGFDGFFGGIMFSTPNVMAETIDTDKFKINDIIIIRQKFFNWSIPIFVLVLVSMALIKTTQSNLAGWGPFAFRAIIVVLLYITTPYILMYSIQFSNFISNDLTKPTSAVQWLVDAYSKAGEKAASAGQDDQFFQTGIPTFQFSLLGGKLNGMGEIFAKGFFFLAMLTALFIALLSLAFQFSIRLLSLIVLSILFPFAIPFALSDKTQGMVEGFFKLWFSYLLQQPAFSLGLAIVLSIAKSALSQGFNIGLLIFFIASLFFLSFVNHLVTRIFGDSWTAISTATHSAMAGGVVGGFVGTTIGGTASKLKDGIVGGRVNGIRSYIGNKIGQKHGLFPKSEEGQSTIYKSGSRTQWINGEAKTVKTEEVVSESHIRNHRKPFNPATYQNASQSESKDSKVTYSAQPSDTSDKQSANGIHQKSQYTFMNDFAKKGWEASVEDEKTGVVKMTGDSYAYRDKASGLTSIYSSKQDAIKDGVNETDLKPYKVSEGKYIDLSTFSKNRRNPHNSYATAIATKKGFATDYAHVKHSSDPVRVKRFLDISKAQHKKAGIDGVMVRRWGNVEGKPTKEKVVRIYTTKEI